MPETAAVYWESKVRIYGFKEKTGLTFASLAFPVGRMEYWGGVLERLADEGGRFELAFLGLQNEKIMQFCIVLADKPECSCLLRLREAQKNETATSLNLDFPVEMISFHGPHFQDRYGIAQAALETLESGDMPILATGCAGTSICIVVPQDSAKIAVRLLAKTFVVPQSVDS